MINVCVKRLLSIVVLVMLTKGFVQAADAPTLREEYLAKAVLYEQAGCLRDAEIYLRVADFMVTDSMVAVVADLTVADLMKISRLTKEDNAGIYTDAAILYRKGGFVIRKDLLMARYSAVRAHSIYKSLGDDRVVKMTQLIADIDAEIENEKSY